MEYYNQPSISQPELDQAAISQLKKSIGRTQLIAVFGLITQVLIVISTIVSVVSILHYLQATRDYLKGPERSSYLMLTAASYLNILAMITLCIITVAYLLQYAGRMKRATNHNGRQGDFLGALSSLNNALLCMAIGYIAAVAYHLFTLSYNLYDTLGHMK